jgi:hypothetical protein
MKTFAKLDSNGVVLNISIADDSWDSLGWVEYTETNPAIIGGDFVDHYFYSPQPYPSWIRNKGIWNAPTELPKDNNNYIWNEAGKEWKLADGKGI